MTREELFLAIGQVEESRLARSEISVQAPKKGKRKIFRNLLVAAIIISMLGLTACAVVGYVLFDSPQEMIGAVFGDQTGFDHGVYTEIPDPEMPGSLLAAQPGFDRVEANPTVVAEDVAPYVSPVGQSISFHGYTLTVDAFLYDSASQCGIVTYTLENPPEYRIDYDGRLEYPGIPAPASFNQYGYDYIIQDKTTDTKLAATFYFQYDSRRSEEPFAVRIRDGMSVDERMAIYQEADAEVKAAYTPEEAVQEAKARLMERNGLEMPDDWWTEERAYEVLRDALVIERSSEDPESEEQIVFDCSESRELNHMALDGGSMIITPISMRIDIADMQFLHKEVGGKLRVHTDNIEEVRICFTDGSEFMVHGDGVNNTLFTLDSSSDGAVTIRTSMFNRIIDINKVESIIVNGTEISRD